MSKYNITIRRAATACFSVTYEAGLLQRVDIDTPGLKPDQIAWMLRIVTVEEDELAALPNMYPFVSVERAPSDLSFKCFWDTYAYKVGKMERAIRLWQMLSEADRERCLRVIPRYKAWLAQKSNMEMLYPETFLSQRRFDNEFKL